MSSSAVGVQHSSVETPLVQTSTHARVLIIDDEASIRDSLETLLTLEGFSVDLAGDGSAGMDLLTRHSYDLLLLDLSLPGESGIELLPRIKSLAPELPVIMITAYGTVGNVVDAIRAGASNFIQKPWDNEKLLADIRLAIGKQKAESEVVQLKRTLKQRYSFKNIVGKSDIMLKLFDLVSQVAPSRSTVLIQGESGTGKELIAKAIHANSPRRDKPFIPVNTGAVPSDLLESTLFGHERGAFIQGLERADAAANAEIVVLNTCTVTASADQDARAAIRRVHRENPQAKIVVTGCYAQRAPEELAVIPWRSPVIGNSHKHKLADIAVQNLLRNTLPSPAIGSFVPLSTLSAAWDVSQRPTADDRRRLFVSDIFAHTELLAAPVLDAAERAHPPQPASAGRLRQPLLILRDPVRPRPKPLAATEPGSDSGRSEHASGRRLPRARHLRNQPGEMGKRLRPRSHFSGVRCQERRLR